MKIILNPETASKLADLIIGIKTEPLSAVTPIKLSFSHGDKKVDIEGAIYHPGFGVPLVNDVKMVTLDIAFKEKD